jgi:hypothetical protein
MNTDGQPHKLLVATKEQAVLPENKVSTNNDQQMVLRIRRTRLAGTATQTSPHDQRILLKTRLVLILTDRWC